MGARNYKDVLYSTIVMILKPLIKVLLRNGVPYAIFADLAKKTYVDVASQEIRLPDKPPTTTHVATITGLTRKEVLRLKNSSSINDIISEKGYNRAARVVSSWVTDSDFIDNRGSPAALPYSGSRQSFTSLVDRYSGDIPARTILDELIRVGAVKHQKDGRLRLTSRAYIPQVADDKKIEILGRDVADLISTIDHNINCEARHAYYQRKVCFDNIPASNFSELRSRVGKKAQASLETIHRELMKYDRELNPKVKGEGRVRAGVGIFYFEETLEEIDNK